MSMRRRFLKLTTITGAALLLPGRSEGTPAPEAPAGTRGFFVRGLNRTFSATIPGERPIELLLESVDDPAVLPAPGLAGHPECFSASFVGPAGAAMRQGTYRLSGPSGSLDVFLVPVGRPRNGRQVYEAAFNSPIAA